MKKIKVIIMLTLFMSASLFAQSRDFGNLEVHYSALPSTFIQANIAKNYGIQRSEYIGLVNITILDKYQHLKAKKATITGNGRNLIGQSIPLKFKKITEGDAIYYIAQYRFTNKEMVNFDIYIKTANKNNNLTFQHTFYVE